MLINTAWRIDLAPQDWLAKDVLRQGVIFMTDIDPVDLDETGKVVLDAIYHQSTPIQFYQGVAGLDYIIPQLAHPVFEDLINSIKHRENKRVKLVDLGCSYGVNGALLKTAGRSFRWSDWPFQSRSDRRPGPVCAMYAPHRRVRSACLCMERARDKAHRFPPKFYQAVLF